MCLTLMMMMILKSFPLVQLSKAKREQVIIRELVLKLFEHYVYWKYVYTSIL